MDWKEKFFHPAGKVENVKPKHSETPVKRTVRYAEMYKSQRLRGNQRNWNGQKSNQLGCHFVLNNKACFICGCFDHLQYNCPNQQRKRMSGLKSFNTARPVNTVRSVNNTRPFSTTRPRAVNTARQFCKTLSWQIAEWLKFLKRMLTCLAAKATSDESMLWHRRLGHMNFKNINKLVKENLVRDLPSKRFEN
ncbi:putative ribonuclease H-like domain-containing protein [Tanacetum coccineum]